ncbi:uncharacterized protein L201_005193 [Kwoniella dendrophila CBS 6074]|uniref:Protein CPL1-like domain-containing protein n=1 Tax=Kwoniella dendrophila CBS 6074 TaxID=1295534 RepID=A0AAX4K0F7_9TREE
MIQLLGFTVLLIMAFLPVTLGQTFAKGYVGCFRVPASGEPTGLNPEEFNLPYTNRELCTATCTESEITSTYAFFWYTIDSQFPELAVPHCRCSQIEPPINQWMVGSTDGSCDAGVTGEKYGAYLTFTDFSFKGCYSMMNPDLPSPVEIERIERCFDYCPKRDDQNRILQNTLNQINDSGEWNCRCYYDLKDLLTFPQTVLQECSVDAYFVYKYNEPISPSQAAARKRNKEKRERQLSLRLDINGGKDRNDKFCPKGLKPCPISKDDLYGDYECIDTTSELESCGGCIHGRHTRGIDCTAMPGVLPGFVTCSDGKCVVSGCEDGFTLVDGECVLTSTNLQS